MRFGLAPMQSRETFDVMYRQAKKAEDAGFDTLWAHEHHSQKMMYPDPLMALAGLASVTSRIRLGTNMLLLPIHHPLRVAQAGAMVDVMSDGRFVLGVAAGYAPSDLAAFGVDSKHRRRRMEEGLTLIRRVWEEDSVDFEGEHTKLEGFELFPRPRQKPRPKIYMGALADPAIRRAARFADGFVLSAGSTIEEARGRAAFYRSCETELGLDSNERLPLGINRVVHVVGSRRERDERLPLFAGNFLSFYDRWGHDDIKHLESEERKYEEAARSHFIFGEPSECIEQIERYAEMGVGHIACLMSFGVRDVDLVDHSLELFCERVLPRFSTS